MDHNLKADPADRKAALAAAIPVLDAARVAMAGTFGNDCVPMICFGLAAEILANVDRKSVPNDKLRRRLEIAVGLLTQTFTECAETKYAEAKQIIVLAAPEGMRVERTD